MIEHAACKTSHRVMIALVMAGASLLAGWGRSPAPLDTVSPPAPSRMIENAASIVSSPSPTPPEPVSTALSLESLAGAWQVAAVQVSTEGVQALSENDPADMGAVLDIAPDRLAWRPREGGGFEDVCTTPQLAADGRVTCGDGAFGPPGTRMARAGDRLEFDWYDGARLVLERMK